MTCGSSGSSILRLRCSACLRCSAASVAYRLLAVPVASVFCRKFEEIFADSKYRCIFAIPIGKANAEIAQLVERNLAKVEVAGPSPVFRSKITTTGKVVVFLCPAVPRRASRRHFAVACRLLAVPVRHPDRSGEIAKIGGGAITAIFWGNGKKQGWKLPQKNDSHKGCHFSAERTIPSCVKTFKN